mmetsp:Transcript_4670/g.14077  ORF Transcript_4670/g.14077 Transcript_4670/m.14077 type:complete len:269 (+) Transcript_4670:3135-3941(+)
MPPLMGLKTAPQPAAWAAVAAVRTQVRGLDKADREDARRRQPRCRPLESRWQAHRGGWTTCPAVAAACKARATRGRVWPECGAAWCRSSRTVGPVRRAVHSLRGPCRQQGGARWAGAPEQPASRAEPASAQTTRRGGQMRGTHSPRASGRDGSACWKAMVPSRRRGAHTPLGDHGTCSRRWRRHAAARPLQRSPHIVGPQAYPLRGARLEGALARASPARAAPARRGQCTRWRAAFRRRVVRRRSAQWQRKTREWRPSCGRGHVTRAA